MEERLDEEDLRREGVRMLSVGRRGNANVLCAAEEGEVSSATACLGDEAYQVRFSPAA